MLSSYYLASEWPSCVANAAYVGGFILAIRACCNFTGASWANHCSVDCVHHWLWFTFAARSVTLKISRVVVLGRAEVGADISLTVVLIIEHSRAPHNQEHHVICRAKFAFTYVNSPALLPSKARGLAHVRVCWVWRELFPSTVGVALNAPLPSKTTWHMWMTVERTGSLVLDASSGPNNTVGHPWQWRVQSG